jgi:hypothetical protein
VSAWPDATGVIGRRLVTMGLASLPMGTAVAALPVPANNRLAFHVVRNGSAIGEHVIGFERTGDTLSVAIAVDIVASAGPIALLRYKHRATEQWKGGQVVSIDADTNDSGTPERMTARRDETGLVVEGSKAARYVAPARALPATHWNRAMLDGPIIDVQDGRLMHPLVALTGTEKVAVAVGSIEARHYTLRGDLNLDTFYDLTGNWAGLRLTARDGSEIRYLRV